MRFGNTILCLALAITTTYSFAPSSWNNINNNHHHTRSMRMQQERREKLLSPKDFISTNLKFKSVFTLTNTLRWEIRSTLTSDEENTTTTTEVKAGGGGGGGGGVENDWPPYPEQLSNGIWDIKNDVQHA